MKKVLSGMMLAAGLLCTQNMYADNFAACPTADVAQALFAEGIPQLKKVTSPFAGWSVYQSTTSEKVTVDYYTQDRPTRPLIPQVTALVTFIQGEPQHVDLPIAVPGQISSTTRHCYYPLYTGSLNSEGVPLESADVQPGYEGMTQVLALEYGEGTVPDPSDDDVDVAVTLSFPSTIQPTGKEAVTVVLANASSPLITYSVSGKITSPTVDLIINQVPANEKGILYNLSATKVAIDGMNYCAANDEVSVPISTTNHTLNIAYAPCGATSYQVSAYYTNWSQYSTAGSYTPDKIPYSNVDIITYAFEQIGNCQGRKGVPSFDCLKQISQFDGRTVVFTGEQDMLLHTTDPWADFSATDSPTLGNLDTIRKVITGAHAVGGQVIMSVGGYSLSDQITQLMTDDNTLSGCTANINGSVQAVAPSSAVARTRFINSIFSPVSGNDALLGSYTFDGVSIDWEPNRNHWKYYIPTVGEPGYSACYQPISEGTVKNFASFLAELKSTLVQKQPGRDLVTIALSANPLDIAYINSVLCDDGKGGQISCLKRIGQIVDYLDVMTYDFHGGWEANKEGEVTNFLSGLYPDPNEPPTVQQQYTYNSDTAISAYLNAGVPSEKLVLGVPAYTRLESGISQSTPQPPRVLAAGLYLPFTTVPADQWTPEGAGTANGQGVYDYKCIMAFFGSRFGITPLAGCDPSQIPGAGGFSIAITKDPQGRLVGLSAYSSNGTGSTFMSFDGVGDPSIDTLTPKIEYVKEHQLGGVMFWELAGDISPSTSKKYSLVYNAYQQLNPISSNKDGDSKDK